jgi:putative N-acetylmannosamine-6-phosphate epimerase
MSLLPKGGLIVSCQARADNPLHGPLFMAAMARAAEQGGAVGLRANGAADIAAIKAVSGLPLIGISKVFAEGEEVYITPTLAAAEAVIDAGAGIVALDCTDRPRRGDDWRAILRRISDAGREGFADISTLEQGLAAADAGAAYVATTLSGYTGATRGQTGPDLPLIAALAARLSVPVVAEGRFNTPDLARAALDAGAHCVVVGTMITNPREITRAFATRLRA